mgnify:FL=1
MLYALNYMIHVGNGIKINSREYTILREEFSREHSNRMTGEKHPMFGKKGILSSMFGKRGILSPNWGRILSEETLMKMSQAKLLYYSDPVNIEKLSSVLKNKTKSEEHKEKLKQSQKKNMRPVRRINITNTNDIKEYESIKKASEDGFNLGHVCTCCNKKRNMHRRFYLGICRNY